MKAIELLDAPPPLEAIDEDDADQAMPEQHAGMDDLNAETELDGAGGNRSESSGEKRGSSAVVDGDADMEHIQERFDHICERLDTYETLTKDDFSTMKKVLDAKTKELRAEGLFMVGRTIAGMVQNLNLLTAFVLAAQKVQVNKKNLSHKTFIDLFEKVAVSY